MLCLPIPSWSADKLPLKRGIFVDEGVKCSERSNATVLAFTGDHLSAARMWGNITSVSREGKRYKLQIDAEFMSGERERAL